VALSDDGLTVAVGAPASGGGQEVGRVAVFRYDSVVGWAQLGSDLYGTNAYDRLVIIGAVVVANTEHQSHDDALGLCCVDIGGRQYNGSGSAL
jgi:hypothetical protein